MENEGVTTVTKPLVLGGDTLNAATIEKEFDYLYQGLKRVAGEVASIDIRNKNTVIYLLSQIAALRVALAELASEMRSARSLNHGLMNHFAPGFPRDIKMKL